MCSQSLLRCWSLCLRFKFLSLLMCVSIDLCWYSFWNDDYTFLICLNNGIYVNFPMKIVTKHQISMSFVVYYGIQCRFVKYCILYNLAWYFSYRNRISGFGLHQITAHSALYLILLLYSYWMFYIRFFFLSLASEYIVSPTNKNSCWVLSFSFTICSVSYRTKISYIK